MSASARRRWRLVALLAVVIVLALNAIGLVRYPGGPLREASADAPFWLDIRPADQGGIEVGNTEASWAQAGVPLQYGTLSIRNPSPWTATVEAIRPLDPSPGLVVDAVYLSKPDIAPTELGGFGPVGQFPDSATVARDYGRLPAVVQPTGDSHDRDVVVLIHVHADEPGPLGWSALAIDYRLGPFTFHTVYHYVLHGCLGPLPSGSTCDSIVWPDGDD